MPQTSPILELQRQRMLLEIEYFTEKEAYRKLTESRGLARLVKRGDAWFPLRVGKSYYNSLNQLCIEVFRTTDQDIEHNFEFGRPVQFFVDKNPQGQGGGPLSYYSFSATISYVDGDRMVVAVPDSAPIIELQNTDKQLGVQLSFDETSYRTMFDALDRVMRAKNNRLAELRDLFYKKNNHSQGSEKKEEKGGSASFYTFSPISFPWLNPTQEKAVNLVLRAKDVAIVHGPPGTGKTTTLVEAIFETLHREPQVLVCAQSNMAVDWISERLVDRGVNVLRIGNPTRVNDKMLSFTYERRFEAHPDYELLWSIRKAIRELRLHRKRGSENWHQKMDRLKSRAAELEIRINAELFGEARVIACTLVGSANRLLEGQKYNTLFIDEAAQALEAASWIPIRRVRRVVLAGDHCQLPPTVKSLAALKAGLGKTLMERLVENHPEAVTLLGVQYRMNEEIMRFSSDWFYGGKVQSAPQIKHRSILDYDIPMEWVSLTPSSDHEGSQAPSGYEEFIGESFGRINKLEAQTTIDVLKQYFTKIGKARILEERIDVGVISPYRAQVQYLRHLVKRDSFFKPYRSLISINTVDGFQGQERDVILISLVRSNDDGQIGFLRDLRRMNVAITRARMKLIILGNPDTMTRHPFYRKLYEYVEALREASTEIDAPTPANDPQEHSSLPPKV
jgi:superfamily I DNA and/or RNA helicase